MPYQALRATFAEIQRLRLQFLQEFNRQVRYNACHERGWSDVYLLQCTGTDIGYAAAKGATGTATRDTVFEFYLLPAYRSDANACFSELIRTSGATRMECQSNEPLISALLFEHCEAISADTILFEDAMATDHRVAGVETRLRLPTDEVFEHASEPVGDVVAVQDSQVVATAGFLTHYNPPFADLFMEVRPDMRRRGFGSLVVQEAKRACYLAGRVPAARCSIQNAASKATLLKAGFRVSGYMLAGTLRDERPQPHRA